MKHVMRFIILVGIVLCTSANTFAQSAIKELRKGNKDYYKNNYKDAEIKYRKSLELDSTYYKGTYNLGNALYKQKNFQEATEKYLSLADQKLDKKTKSKIWHNLGNTYVEQQKYQEALNAYKNALKSNPKDMDTKYNYEYARKKLIQQQQQQQQQNQQQQQDKKNEDKQQKEQKQDQQKNEQQQKPQMNKQDAERILQAINNNEKNIQKKLDEKQQKSQNTNIENDW